MTSIAPSTQRPQINRIDERTTMNSRIVRYYVHCIVALMLLVVSQPAYAQFELDPIVRDRNPLAGEWTDEVELDCVMGEPPQNVRTLDCPISGSIPGTWWSLRVQTPTGWQMRLANKSNRAILLTLRVWDRYADNFSWMKHPPQLALLPAQGTRILDYPSRVSDDGSVSAAVLEWHYVDADGKSAWQAVRENNGIQYRWSSPGLAGSCFLEFRDMLLERATSVFVTTTVATDPDRPDSTQRPHSVNITQTQNGTQFLNGTCLYLKQVSAPNPARSVSTAPAKIQR